VQLETERPRPTKGDFDHEVRDKDLSDPTYKDFDDSTAHDFDDSTVHNFDNSTIAHDFDDSTVHDFSDDSIYRDRWSEAGSACSGRSLSDSNTSADSSLPSTHTDKPAKRKKKKKKRNQGKGKGETPAKRSRRRSPQGAAALSKMPEVSEVPSGMVKARAEELGTETRARMDEAEQKALPPTLDRIDLRPRYPEPPSLPPLPHLFTR
jgi:hypothetical protein